MNEQLEHVVIVGGGHGGANVAALMRQHEYAGRVTIIGNEVGAPYQRPPLSKAYLKGSMTDDELLIKPSEFYATQDIVARWGENVVGVDAQARTIVLDSGEQLAFDALVLATGAGPRRLSVPGADLDGIHYLRTHDDARALNRVIRGQGRLVIVGGGYVGLEVAASAAVSGCEVVVLEREDRALARVASKHLADFLVDHHAQHGVEIVTSADVRGFHGAPHVDGVVLSDGRVVECDAALVGVGAIPRVELAEMAGLTCQNGVVVDDAAMTSAAGIYAVGDMTLRPLVHYDGHHRLESIPSAVEQAKQAVAAILGLPKPKTEVPWFWSDQYELKIKIAGIVAEGTESVVRGDPGSGRFAVFHLRGGELIAAETVNAAPEFMFAKRLIEQATGPVDAERLADPAVSLKELAAGAPGVGAVATS